MKPRSPRLAATGGVLLLAVSLAAEERATPPGATRRLTESLGFSANPAGLQHVLDLRWTWRLNSSPSPLLSGAHFAVGASHSLTPSYTRLGAWVELAPLSILDLRGGAEGSAYFGNFGSLTSFNSYTDPFGEEARDARKDDARSGTGSRLYLSPRLRMRAGPLLMTAGADLEWWWSSAEGPLYYEPARDTLLAVDGGRVLRTSAALLRRHDWGRGGELAYGVNHSLTYVLDAAANRSQRIGLTVVRQFGPRRFGLHSPRIAGQVSYYLSDPFRKGQVAASLGLSIGPTR